MADHPNVDLLRQGYAAFEAGDLPAVGELFDPGIVWHVPGHNALTGDYEGRDAVMGFFGKLMEMTGGKFRQEVHDVLANDEHGAVMVTGTGERPDGRTWTGRSVQVWHMKDGKATEFWFFTDDEAAADAFFS
jgi:ketosteroid isomerase-like protein